MLTVFQSERFQQQYNSYKLKIQQIEDVKVAERAKKLLADLVREVRLLDKHNLELFSSNSIPFGINDAKLKISNLRKELDSIVKL
jgi:hypothetical protein